MTGALRFPEQSVYALSVSKVASRIWFSVCIDRRPADAPEQASREIDATGMYVLPGFVDLHLHSGDIPKTPEAEYVYKLWLAHGVTTGRGVPFASPEFSESEKVRSARGENRYRRAEVDGLSA